MNKIAILGGTFDPVTNAHLDIARQVRDKYDLDILFLPAKNTRWKENISDSKHRIEMLKLALKDENRMDICYEEINNSSNEKNYTIDTILTLIDKYKGYKIYYIIGSDQLEKLHKWYEIDNLCKMVKFIVIHRENYQINEENLILFDCIDSKIKMKDISSTSIREYNSIDTKKEVLDYIYNSGIYAYNLMKKLVEEERYLHCLRVAKLAKEIAISNNYDPEKAYYAGMIHDCAKRLSHEKSIEYMLKYCPEHIKEPFGLYHQYIGDIVAKEYFKINNEEILHSIKVHTTGSLNMSILDKIIYCADKLELGRGYDSSKLIDYCKIDINYGYCVEYIKNYLYVLNKRVKMSDESKEIYKKCKNYIEKYELKTIFKGIDDKLGLNITIYNTKNKNTLSDYTIVATASSDRQLLAIIDEIENIVVKYGFDFHHSEKQYKSGWVLIDLCNIIVHIFKDNIRNAYSIEENLKDCIIISEGEINGI